MLDKLIEAEGTEEVLKILSAQGYNTSEVDPKDPHFYDSLVKREHTSLFKNLSKIVPDIKYFNFFLYTHDYLNIKALLKALCQGRDTDIHSDSGSIPYELLKKAIVEKNYSILTQNMSEGIAEALKAYSESMDPQTIDIILDKRCFMDMLNAAENSNSKFIIEYIRTYIDVTNLKNFLRLRKMGKDLGFAERVFSNGGSIKTEFFINLYNKKDDEVSSAFKGHKYESLITFGLSHLNKPGGLGAFELECENAIMDFVRKARYIAFGPEVVAGYIIAKETEFKNIRIIMAGKSAGLSSDKIRERLRKTYA